MVIKSSVPQFSPILPLTATNQIVNRSQRKFLMI
jgi:hypothetical protein